MEIYRNLLNLVKLAEMSNYEWIRASKTIEKALGLAVNPASGPQSPQITPKSGNLIKFSIIYQN